MIGDPLRALRHRVEDAEPTPVPGRVSARGGRAGSRTTPCRTPDPQPGASPSAARRSLRRPPRPPSARSEEPRRRAGPAPQCSSDGAVQCAAPGASDSLVDRLLNERMRDLVGELATALLLCQRVACARALRGSAQVCSRGSLVWWTRSPSRTRCPRIATTSSVARCGSSSGCRRTPTRSRSRSGSRSSRGEERSAPSSTSAPRRSIAKSGFPRVCSSSQSTSASATTPFRRTASANSRTASRPERLEAHHVEPPLLLEPRDHLRGRRLLTQLRPRRRQYEHRCLGGASGDVRERLPGGRVRQVNVVQHEHDRRAGSEVGQQDGQALEQPKPRRLSPRHRTPGDRNAVEQDSKIVEESGAELARSPPPEARRGADRAPPPRGRTSAVSPSG